MAGQLVQRLGIRFVLAHRRGVAGGKQLEKPVAVVLRLAVGKKLRMLAGQNLSRNVDAPSTLRVAAPGRLKRKRTPIAAVGLDGLAGRLQGRCPAGDADGVMVRISLASWCRCSGLWPMALRFAAPAVALRLARCRKLLAVRADGRGVVMQGVDVAAGQGGRPTLDNAVADENMRAAGVVVVGADGDPVAACGIVGERSGQTAAVGSSRLVHGYPPSERDSAWP